MSIAGTGAVDYIKTVKSVFAFRFSPDLDTEMLSLYLKEKLGHEVTCPRIDTVNSRYASFNVSAECKDVDEMYNPELWLNRALVQFNVNQL